MPRVYIPNDNGHDFTAAAAYGQLIFLTRGPVDKLATRTLCETIQNKMSDSQPEDCILINSLSTLVGIASALQMHKWGSVDYLIHTPKGYVRRTVEFPKGP